MKKIALISATLVLSACSHTFDFGDKDRVIPEIPEIQPSHEFFISDDAKLSNSEILTMNSSVLDEHAVTNYLRGEFGDKEYDEYINELMSGAPAMPVMLSRSAARRANSDKNTCKSEHDCNQVIMDRMQTWLIENINDFENASPNEMRRALIAAGYKKDIPGHWDDLKAWIKSHKQEITERAEIVYNTPGMGKPKEYWLDNTDFTAVMTSGKIDKLTFQLDDDGKITGIKFCDTGTGSSLHNPSVFYTNMPRIDKNKFDMTSNETNGTLEMKTFAKELGLKYSDFGVVTADGFYKKRDITGFNIPFIGGFESKRIDRDDIIANMDEYESIVFHGIAKGTVNPSNNAAKLGAKNLDIEDKNATLTLKQDGWYTLNAKFDNWYNIDISTKDSLKYTISGLGFDDTDVNIPEEYMFDYSNYSTTRNLFEVEFYGDGDTPEEAVALFQYQHTAKNPSPNPNDYDDIIDNGNINVFIGFGGTIDKK